MWIFFGRVPLLCTRGDALADRVAAEPLGITVPERDVHGVVAGIKRLLDDLAFAQKCRQGTAKISAELSWDLAVEPLVRFCQTEGSYARAGIYLAMKKLYLSPPRIT